MDKMGRLYFSQFPTKNLAVLFTLLSLIPTTFGATG